jgi:hypothetical protein
MRRRALSLCSSRSELPGLSGSQRLRQPTRHRSQKADPRPPIHDSHRHGHSFRGRLNWRSPVQFPY